MTAPLDIQVRARRLSGVDRAFPRQACGESRGLIPESGGGSTSLQNGSAPHYGAVAGPAGGV